MLTWTVFCYSLVLDLTKQRSCSIYFISCSLVCLVDWLSLFLFLLSIIVGIISCHVEVLKHDFHIQNFWKSFHVSLFFSCVCVIYLSYAHMGWEEMCAHVHTRRGKVNIWHLSLSLSTLFVKKGSLTETVALNKLIFFYVSWNATLVLKLSQKAFYILSHFPSPI